MIRPFNGKMPRIAESAFVSEAAYIIGDVELGENSSVWPGAVLRGDYAPIKVGKNTQIEDNSVVHSGTTLLIGDNVHIGHGAVIHCTRIGNNVLIGNNATLLDDAEIGDCCIIGANSLVTQSMKIPPYSFVVGVPARIRGKVSPEQLARLEKGVSLYLKLAVRLPLKHNTLPRPAPRRVRTTPIVPPLARTRIRAFIRDTGVSPAARASMSWSPAR